MWNSVAICNIAGGFSNICWINSRAVFPVPRIPLGRTLPRRPALRPISRPMVVSFAGVAGVDVVMAFKSGANLSASAGWSNGVLRVVGFAHAVRFQVIDGQRVVSDVVANVLPVIIRPWRNDRG
jgi:hypothetical protein